MLFKLLQKFLKLPMTTEAAVGTDGLYRHNNSNVKESQHFMMHKERSDAKQNFTGISSSHYSNRFSVYYQSIIKIQNGLHLARSHLTRSDRLISSCVHCPKQFLKAVCAQCHEASHLLQQIISSVGNILVFQLRGESCRASTKCVIKCFPAQTQWTCVFCETDTSVLKYSGGVHLCISVS